MEPDEVKDLYDAGYAGAYDQRFLLAPWPKQGAEFELDVLRDLTDHEGARWLDIGCGTGWFLSQFPGLERAGLDISPAMLERAREANPDAIFLQEGDFRDDVADWHGAWSVISCMWTAYNYVRSMFELDDLIANMVRWTRPGGSVFIPVMDLEDLRYVQVPYEIDPEVWYGTIALTGVTWTWDEPETGKRHEHLIAPHVEHFVRLLSPHFERVEVVRYPEFQPGWIPRKAVVATGRRPIGEQGEAEVVWQPHPGTSGEADAPPSNDAAVDHAAVEALRADVDAVQRAMSALRDALFPQGPDGPYDTIGHTHVHVANLRTEVAALHNLVSSATTATSASAGTPDARPGGTLSSVSSRQIAKELGRRLNPFRLGTWKAVGRRLRR